VCVAVAVSVTVAVAVLVVVGVEVDVTVAVSVAVGVGVTGVGLAVAVGVGVGSESSSFLILISCGARTTFPLCSSSAVSAYSAGLRDPMLTVMTEEDCVGWEESDITLRRLCPICFKTLSINLYLLSGIPAAGRAVIPIWTTCGWPGVSIPLAG